MLQIVRAEKLDLKKWRHLSSFHASFLSYGPKKCIFCNSLLASARNLRVLKQFTYMDLKVFISLSENDMVYWGLRHRS